MNVTTTSRTEIARAAGKATWKGVSAEERSRRGRELAGKRVTVAQVAETQARLEAQLAALQAEVAELREQTAA